MMSLANPIRPASLPEDTDAGPIADLVAMACARVERQAAYAALAAKGGVRAAALRDWLFQARSCVVALARAQVVRQPLAVVAGADGLLIANHVHIADPSLCAGVAGGGQLSACLCTLGYGQEAAFNWLGRDYALHHVQTELARETLFALARQADRAEQRRLPGWRIRRIPVKAHAMCGPRHLWEPAQVQALLAAFDQTDPGVVLTDTGFFQPLHSLLSLTLMQAPRSKEVQGRSS